jgi:hypothetical protein
MLSYRVLSSDQKVWAQVEEGHAKGTRCISLDDFVRDVPAPRAIKCDVDGAEIEVFRGAENLLRDHRPWILCELHSEAKGRAWRELISGLGYSCESVDSNHVLALPRMEI